MLDRSKWIRGAFDDESDDDFWGLYATVLVPGLPGMKLDLYYLGLDREDAFFAQGAGREERHTLGTRFFGALGPFELNNEAMVQLGTYGSGDILACRPRRQPDRSPRLQ